LGECVDLVRTLQELGRAAPFVIHATSHGVTF
jgi:hypothetical protein